MESLFVRSVIVFAAAFLCTLAAGASLAPERGVLAVAVQPGTPPAEKEPAASELVREPQRSPERKNPFEQPDDDPYVIMRQRREKRMLIIILGVVALVCAYWLTSGKLHHRIPRS